MVQNFYNKPYYFNKLLFFLILICLIHSVTSNCNALNCPPLRGLCSNNLCVCEDGYATVNNKQIKNNGIFCNYNLKSRYIAFLLEFFFPIGAGHFYSGKTILASIKLGLFVFLVVSFIIVLFCKSVNRFNANSGTITLSFLIILCLLGIVLMQIFDLIGYACGIYLDGNGVEMS